MAGNGNDMYADHRNWSGSCIHWGPKAGSAGSPWWTTGWQYGVNPYSGKKPGLEFPSVPYFASDFHCDRACNAWTNPFILNYGWLSGLTDLNTEKEYVQQRIADYLTELLSIGVSGVRIDAAKHIYPLSLAKIFKKLKDNLGGGEYPEDFSAYLEVLFGNEKELLLCGGGDYSYGQPFVDKMKSEGLSDDDIDKIKIWGSDYPKEFPICGYWEITPKRHVIGLDCHDDQNPGSSSMDMQDKGSVYIRERNSEKHRNFNIQMFTRTEADWKMKLLLSSYSFMENGGAGFPDGKSECSACTGEQCKKNCQKSVPYQKAYNPNSIGYDTGDKSNWKEGSYTRVHRDQAIINAMRNWMGLEELNEEQLYGAEKAKAKKMGL
jgi:alpha-amylase